MGDNMRFFFHLVSLPVSLCAFAAGFCVGLVVIPFINGFNEAGKTDL